MVRSSEARKKTHGGAPTGGELLKDKRDLLDELRRTQYEKPPDAVALSIPRCEPRGILMQWKKDAIDRQTALQAIQSQYDAQLEALRYQLTKAVTVSNAQVDCIAEEFLKKLDSEHLEVLKEFGLKNLDTRSNALIEVRDIIAAKLREVQGKSWPQSLVERTIDDLLDLEKRICAEMMRELGA